MEGYVTISEESIDVLVLKNLNVDPAEDGKRVGMFCYAHHMGYQICQSIR